MSGYALIALVVTSWIIYTRLEHIQSVIQNSQNIESVKESFVGYLKVINLALLVIALISIGSFSITWWSDRNGLPTDEVAIKAFTASSDGLSTSNGLAEGYCYGPGGGIESSAPCVLLVSAPRVIERPDSKSGDWCFLLNYLVEADPVDRGIDWSERALRTNVKEVSVCGQLELSKSNGNGTKHDYRSWKYKSEDLVGAAIRKDNNY